MRRLLRHVRLVRILLQKSKIDRSLKSRRSRFFGDSAVAILRRADAKLRGGFCAKPPHIAARETHERP